MLNGRVIATIILVLILGIISVSAAEVPKAVGYNPGYNNVRSFGAVPNDGKDDTAAFRLALMSGQPLYVPAGEYEISEPITLLDSSIIGCGAEKSVIVSTSDSARDPIIIAGGRCVIKDIKIKFANNCVNGSEIAGERVGIYAGGKKNLKRGTSIQNVHIENVGTGILSPLQASLQSGLSHGCAFSVTFESISVKDFSYRGIDMQDTTRTGNIYRNIYISSGKYEANAGFYLNTIETECAITDLTVAESRLKTPVRIMQAETFSITNVTFDSVELTKDNTAFIYFDQTVGEIESLNIINSAPKGQYQSFIRVGSNMYRDYTFDCAGYIHIKNLNIFDKDVKTEPDSKQYFVSRKNGFVNHFTIKIDRCYIEASAELKAQYETFKIDESKDYELILEENIE